MLLQDAFLVTFSIFYGIMLNGCIGLKLFSIKHFKRFLFSFCFINILSFFIGGVLYVFILRGELICLSQFMGLFLISLVVFIPYRIIHWVIAYNSLCLYDTQELKGALKKRICIIAEPKYQCYSIIWYIACVVIGYLLMKVISF